MRDVNGINQKNRRMERLTVGSEEPLWLLQKEDTRFLCFSFLLSTLAHGILFIVMAATHIFHPFAGSSTSFDLVWFSPAPISGTQAVEGVQQTAKGEKNAAKQVKSPIRSSGELPAAAQPPAKEAPENPAATTPENPAAPPPPEEPVKSTESEMVISRFGGKVAEIVEKKNDARPAFKIVSSTVMKNGTTRAKVHTIKETVNPVPPPAKVEKPSEQKIAKQVTGNRNKTRGPRTENTPQRTTSMQATGNGEKPAATASSKPSQAVEMQGALFGKSVHEPLFPSVSDSREGKGTAPSNAKVANGEPRISTGGTSVTPESRKPAAPAAGGAGTASTANGVNANQSAGTTPQAPASPERKLEASAERPSPPVAEKPRAIFHPPLSGDLKLIITGDREVKVEASFREYRKNRRDKPMSKREARNRRDIKPKVVRTKENVNEAVIETAEEGIYDLTVTSSDGKPVEAAFVLMIHEAGPGAKSRNLGKRSVSEKTTIARVLMPEGILWDDDASFTGNMEDSESITKFQAETGLIWREYK